MADNGVDEAITILAKAQIMTGNPLPSLPRALTIPVLQRTLELRKQWTPSPDEVAAALDYLKRNI